MKHRNSSDKTVASPDPKPGKPKIKMTIPISQWQDIGGENQPPSLAANMQCRWQLHLALSQRCSHQPEPLCPWGSEGDRLKGEHCNSTDRGHKQKSGRTWYFGTREKKPKTSTLNRFEARTTTFLEFRPLVVTRDGSSCVGFWARRFVCFWMKYTRQLYGFLLRPPENHLLKYLKTKTNHLWIQQGLLLL